MAIVRQWRNVKMLRRAGRGHDPAGVQATTSGQLAVPCRACPHQGINLPDDWDQAPPEFRYVRVRYWLTSTNLFSSFLYILIVALDANFRQKNRHRPTTYEDVCLSPGWSYFVEHSDYIAHVSRYANQEEVNSDLQLLCEARQTCYLNRLVPALHFNRCYRQT